MKVFNSILGFTTLALLSLGVTAAPAPTDHGNGTQPTHDGPQPTYDLPKPTYVNSLSFSERDSFRLLTLVFCDSGTLLYPEVTASLSTPTVVTLSA